MHGRSWLSMIFGLMAACSPAVLRADPPPTIELRRLDGEVIHGATFQSHNQKVVHSPRGIFVAYLRDRNAEYTSQSWRVLRIPDWEAPAEVLAEGIGATNPPVLEVDDEYNLYVGRVDWVTGHAYIEVRRASENYAHPAVTELPGGAAGKYAMALDRQRRQLVFFSHNNQFFRVGLDGELRSAVTLLQPGRMAVLQYPSLCFDEQGVLYAGWTTSRPEGYLYHDIHVMRSRDGGVSWETLTGSPLPLPVIADDSGPAQRVTRDDEFEVHTWLASLLAGQGKLHAMYQAQTSPSRFHYVRYDLATGLEDIRRWPDFRGDELSLNGLDGTFSGRLGDPAAPVVAVVKDALRPRLAALISLDQGATWSDLGVSDEVTAPYAISGCRELTSDGFAIGAFTDAIEPSDAPRGQSTLILYRVRAVIPTN